MGSLFRKYLINHFRRMFPVKHLLLSLIVLSSFGAEEGLSLINRKHVYVPQKLGKLSLAETSEGFSILRDDVEIPVKFHNTNKLLRQVQEMGALKQFLNEGSIFVSQDNGGDYILTAKGKLKGGGPVTGFVVYWGVKGVGYAGVVAAAFGAGAVIGTVASPLAPVLAAQSATTIATVSAAGNIGASVASSAAWAATGAPIVAGIETAATTAGTFVALMPWCP